METSSIRPGLPVIVGLRPDSKSIAIVRRRPSAKGKVDIKVVGGRRLTMRAEVLRPYVAGVVAKPADDGKPRSKRAGRARRK